MCVCTWMFVFRLLGPGKLSQRCVRTPVICLGWRWYTMYVWVYVGLSCWVTLPSSLLFSNPSCTGQHMERASISAPSPAYLLDTQVGTVHSSPLRLLRPLSPPTSVLVDVCVWHGLIYVVEHVIFTYGSCPFFPTALHCVVCSNICAAAFPLSFAYCIILYVVAVNNVAISGLFHV